MARAKLHYLLWYDRSPRQQPSERIEWSKIEMQQLERGQAAETRLSQAPLTVEISLPLSTDTTSSNYRSANDPANQVHKRFLLSDTPGHGKLRHHAFDSILKRENTKGIIFMVDATNLTPSIGNTADENNEIRETAEYLHEILLVLQKRATGARKMKAPKQIAFLIAANKLDLFTALPPTLVKSVLESEISKVRDSRATGLLGSGVGMNELAMEDEKDRLGDGSEAPFEFKQMEEVGISVQVLGGNVVGADGPNVAAWWAWIGRCL